MNPVLRALLLSLIGLGIVVGAIWLLAGRSADGLEKRALAFFEVYWSDTEDQEAQTDRMLAHSALDATSNRKVYTGRVYYKKTLGAWKGSARVVSQTPDGHGGGRIALDMTFEHGTVVARFEFVEEQGKPMLSAIALDLPRPKDAGDTPRNPRVFVAAVLRIWAQGQPDSIWDQFSTDLQTRRWPRETFRRATTSFLAERSAKPKIEIVSVEDDGEDAVTITAKILFEKAPVDAVLDMQWNAGRWRPTRFDVHGLK